jgi:hypothetical protein
MSLQHRPIYPGCYPTAQAARSGRAIPRLWYKPRGVGPHGEGLPYSSDARSGDYFLNAPFVIAAVTVFGSLMWLLVAAAVAGDAAARDVQTRMHPLTYTAPLSKADYLGDDSSLPSSSMPGNCPVAILLEPAVLYIPGTSMYNAAMYTRVRS